MEAKRITSLDDLRQYRTAPELTSDQLKVLDEELELRLIGAEWFTIGIMAPSYDIALVALKEVESRFEWSHIKADSNNSYIGPVFLKANQKSNSMFVRVEHQLGEGILISCQSEQEIKTNTTYGPFPLNFFSKST